MVEEAEERAERRGFGSCVKEEEEAGTGGFTGVDLFLNPSSLFFCLTQFYHKTSTYCINNRIPGPLILNRIPKYNR